MNDILSYAWTNGLAFVFILSVIVFIHEMGHFLVARMNGVRVEVFSIGFGPELFGWNTRSGTRWKVSLLPLGGYVKFFGDANAASMPDAEAKEMTDAEKAVSFPFKRLPQRAAIVVAGPLANFVLAIAIFAVLFATIGQRVTPPDISTVIPDSAAAEAGLQPGDLVLRIDDQPISRFEDMQAIVRESAGETLRMVVRRDGKEVAVTITPRAVEREDRFGNVQRFGLIGVTRAGVTFVKLDPIAAVGAAFTETGSLSVATLRAVGQIIKGTRGTEELGGPVRIIQLSGQVAKEGPLTVFWFMALLSINLGLINLMPVPMLDGGHLLFYAFEALRGRPLSERTQEYGFRIGLAMVLALIVFATWNDLVQLRLVDYVVGLFS